MIATINIHKIHSRQYSTLTKNGARSVSHADVSAISNSIDTVHNIMADFLCRTFIKFQPQKIAKKY